MRRKKKQQSRAQKQLESTRVFSVLTFLGDEGLEEVDGVVVGGPSVHLAVRVTAFLRQFIPTLWLGQELRDGALGVEGGTEGESHECKIVASNEEENV